MSKQERTALARGLVLVVALALACDPAEPPSGDVRNGSSLEDGHAAALRGIDWMIDNADALPPGWAHPFLSRVSRVVSDPQRSRALEVALARDARSGRHVSVPADLSDPKHLAPARLTPILFELARRRELGIEDGEAFQQLQRLIDTNEAVLIDRLAPMQEVVYAHLFDSLGLRWSLDIETLIERARGAAAREPVEQLAANAQYLYTLTHLVLARSGYLQTAIDPVELDFVPPILERALDLLLTASRESGSDVFSYDLQAEILMSRQLLGAAESEAARRTRGLLIASQARDGRFGPPGRPNRRNAHVTASAIFGLAEHPPRLRPRTTP